MFLQVRTWMVMEFAGGCVASRRELLTRQWPNRRLSWHLVNGPGCQKTSLRVLLCQPVQIVGACRTQWTGAGSGFACPRWVVGSQGPAVAWLCPRLSCAGLSCAGQVRRCMQAPGMRAHARTATSHAALSSPHGPGFSAPSQASGPDMALVSRLALDIARGCAHLHEHDIVHGGAHWH